METPPELSKVATRLAVLREPMFCRAKETVTVSPGSIAPLAGEKLSESKAAPAATMIGAGLAAVTMEVAALFAELLSVELVLTEAVLVSEPGAEAEATMVIMALEPGVRLPNGQVMTPPELVQEPAVEMAEMNAVCAGNVSVRILLTAMPGPKLVTITV